MIYDLFLGKIVLNEIPEQIVNGVSPPVYKFNSIISLLYLKYKSNIQMTKNNPSEKIYYILSRPYLKSPLIAPRSLVFLRTSF